MDNNFRETTLIYSLFQFRINEFEIIFTEIFNYAEIYRCAYHRNHEEVGIPLRKVIPHSKHYESTAQACLPVSEVPQEPVKMWLRLSFEETFTTTSD